MPVKMCQSLQTLVKHATKCRAVWELIFDPLGHGAMLIARHEQVQVLHTLIALEHENAKNLDNVLMAQSLHNPGLVEACLET